MTVNLIVDSSQLASSLPDFQKVLSTFSYTSDNDYRAFERGDKVAEYGLTALVVGGAAAVAAKTGLWKVLWKFLLVGWKLVVAALAAVGAMLKKLFSQSEAPAHTSQDAQ
jgi:uncharacterized membrane-anchored protein